MLPPKAWERLQPFLEHKRARQRLLLYYMAAGSTVPDLRGMTIADLKHAELPAPLVQYRDEWLEQHPAPLPDRPAWLFPSGAPFAHTDFYRLIRQATVRTLGLPMSRAQFVHYIRTGRMPC